jgi:hypothetical protein
LGAVPALWRGFGRSGRGELTWREGSGRRLECLWGVVGAWWACAEECGVEGQVRFKWQVRIEKQDILWDARAFYSGQYFKRGRVAVDLPPSY